MRAWWNPFGRLKKPAASPASAPPPGLAQLLAGLPEDEKGRALAQQIRWAEEAYDEMYEGRSPSGAYSNMKEALHQAIKLAGELGLAGKVQELERVLEHRKSVFRGQGPRSS